MQPRVEIWVDGLDHPEGLAFDDAGVLWCGGEAGQIYRVDVQRRCFEQVASTGGFCLGIAVSPSGSIIVCDLKRRQVLEMDRSGRVTVRVDGPLRTPNSAAFGRDGTMYFSDSGDFHGGNGVIYRVPPGGEPEALAGGFAFANGIALDRDEQWLYVVESNADAVTRVSLADGRRERAAEGLKRVPDGVTVTRDGGLVVGCYASDNIYRVEPDGSVYEYAWDPDGVLLARPTNCAFAGTALYVANLGRWHISRIETPFEGSEAS